MTVDHAEVHERAHDEDIDVISTSTALAQRDPADLIMSDDEIRRTYRVAEALAASGMWKDVKKAEAAFAKIIIGRDLGLTPAQSMQGIHIVDGGVQMHYAQMGQFVRARPGYDYRSAWIKVQRWARIDDEPDPVEVVGLPDESGGATVVRLPGGEVVGVLEASVWEEHVLVWLDEEDPLDLREVFGAVTRFTAGGESRGISRYTYDDARQANLIKDGLDRRAAWNTSRRNMYLARSMSNGCKWLVPEVMNGMPIYAPGELAAGDRPSLTAPVGDGDDAGQGIDLGPKVERIIERATTLGHRGLSNRAAVEMAIGQRAPSVVNDWIKRANAELDNFKAQKDAAAAGEAAAPEERPVETPPEDVTGPVEQPPEMDRPEELPDDAVVADEPPEDDPRARLDDHLADEQRKADDE